MATRKPRKSYAARTGSNTRAAVHLAAGHFEKIAFHEDAEGRTIREWKPSELQRFTNADLKAVLSNRVAIEEAEMLGTVPPSAVRYCVTKGFLVAAGGYYRITLKAAMDLDLPLRFRGRFEGRKIPFAPSPALSVKKA